MVFFKVVPCSLVSSGHGAEKRQTRFLCPILSYIIWFNVLLATDWELAGLFALCGVWSALRARRVENGTFRELTF